MFPDQMFYLWNRQWLFWHNPTWLWNTYFARTQLGKLPVSIFYYWNYDKETSQLQSNLVHTHIADNPKTEFHRTKEYLHFFLASPPLLHTAGDHLTWTTLVEWDLKAHQLLIPLEGNPDMWNDREEQFNKLLQFGSFDCDF